jgi:hypothetical protein
MTHHNHYIPTGRHLWQQLPTGSAQLPLDPVALHRSLTHLLANTDPEPRDSTSPNMTPYPHIEMNAINRFSLLINQGKVLAFS